MKKILLPPNVNLQLLTEQLFAAFPEWKYQTPFGVRTDVTITASEVEFPDDTNEDAVQVMIDLHDPGGQSINQKDEASTQAAKSEFINLPDWLKNATYADIEQAIQDRTIGNVTRQQALALVDNAANLADVKTILRGLVNAVYGLVEVNQKIARVLLAVIFFLRKR